MSVDVTPNGVVVELDAVSAYPPDTCEVCGHVPEPVNGEELRYGRCYTHRLDAPVHPIYRPSEKVKLALDAFLLSGAGSDNGMLSMVMPLLEPMIRRYTRDLADETVEAAGGFIRLLVDAVLDADVSPQAFGEKLAELGMPVPTRE